MTDPVEVIARGLSALRVRRNMWIEKRELTPEALQESVDYGWGHFAEEASAALSALEEGGWTLLPGNPRPQRGHKGGRIQVAVGQEQREGGRGHSHPGEPRDSAPGPATKCRW